MILFITKFWLKKMKKAKHTGIGIAIGVVIGSIIGVATDDLGLWLSLGIAIGAFLGIALMKETNNGDDDSIKSG